MNFNYLIYGIISIIFGNILINYIIDHNKYELKNYIDIIYLLKKYYIFHILLFIFGIIIYFILEIINLDKWYCQKICIGDKCMRICTKKI